MITKKEFLITVGIFAIAVNVFVMLIAPFINGEVYELLRSVSIALFGSGLILFDILQKMMGRNIFKNDTDISKLGTFFLVFWGVIGMIFDGVSSSIADFVMDWGLLVTGVVLIISVSLMDVAIKEG